MIELYHKVCVNASKMVTNSYSTSFSLGIRMFAEELREPIYNIYGFVRFADEIVDTFHDYDQPALLREFRRDTYQAIERGISLNPVLHAFQKVVKKYDIGLDLIDSFLDSMEMDLESRIFDRTMYDRYIFGSAEVVGLMCLKVFVAGDSEEHERLKEPAMKLGSAFQKVNFLRDIKSDFKERGRVYFPGVAYESFSCADKEQIEAEIQADFDKALIGINALPKGARLGVYLAYQYFQRLLTKIQNCSAAEVKERRIRVRDASKMMILGSSALRYNLRAH